MAQNIYDDPAFLAGYSDFPRSRLGLEATSEWPALRALLPELGGKRVVELGCGFGHLSRWLADNGAKSVLGIDLSEKMLARAAAENAHPAITFRRDDLDSLELPAGSADLVVSSMTLHYIEDFKRICRALYAALTPGGHLVFSVEHPIYAARAKPEWIAAADGGQAFAITDYLVEGRKTTDWIVDGVVKYHRTIASMLNTLRDAGFAYSALDEWKPSDTDLQVHPEWGETELIRPMFLIAAASKPA